MRPALLAVLIVLSPLAARASKPTDAQKKVLHELHGWGSGTTGGKEGDIYEVTNLNDSGDGSLRKGLEQKEARWIVFKVQGRITLQTPIKVQSNKTVDARGHTVVIDTATTTYDDQCPSKENDHDKNVTGFVIDGVQNVILLNLTFDDNFKPLHVDCEDSDAITITNSSHIWVHHCTFKRWADGAIDIVGDQGMSTDVTVSWSTFDDIFQAALWKVRKASFHHNVCRNVGLRCPDAEKKDADNPAHIHSYNNYITRWQTEGVMIADNSDLWDDHNMLEPGTQHKAYHMDGDGCIERNGGKTYGEVTFLTKNCTISNDFKDHSKNNSGDRSKCESSDCWAHLRARILYGDSKHHAAGATLPAP